MMNSSPSSLAVGHWQVDFIVGEAVICTRLRQIVRTVFTIYPWCPILMTLVIKTQTITSRLWQIGTIYWEDNTKSSDLQTCWNPMVLIVKTKHFLKILPFLTRYFFNFTNTAFKITTINCNNYNYLLKSDILSEPTDNKSRFQILEYKAHTNAFKTTRTIILRSCNVMPSVQKPEN